MPSSIIVFIILLDFLNAFIDSAFQRVSNKAIAISIIADKRIDNIFISSAYTYEIKKNRINSKINKRKIQKFRALFFPNAIGIVL